MTSRMHSSTERHFVPTTRQFDGYVTRTRPIVDHGSGSSSTPTVIWSTCPSARVVDRVIARQKRTLHQVELLAERGVQPQASWAATGDIDRLHQQIRWSEDHREFAES